MQKPLGSENWPQRWWPLAAPVREIKRRRENEDTLEELKKQKTETPASLPLVTPTATQTMMIQLVMNGEVRGTLTEDQVSKSGVLSWMSENRQLEREEPMEGEDVIIDLSSDEDIYPESLDLFIYLTQCGATGFMRELSVQEIDRFLRFIVWYDVNEDILHHIQKNVMMYPCLGKKAVMDVWARIVS
jgi:hypothetical protein